MTNDVFFLFAGHRTSIANITAAMIML